MKIRTNKSGRIVRVDVPLVTTSDPPWYRAAAQQAGLSVGDTYPLRVDDDRRFLTSANAKIAKTNKKSASYLSAIMHLAPHHMSGANVCPMAAGCARVCVGYNGHGMLDNGAFRGTGERWLVNLVARSLSHSVHACRIAKTRLFRLDRETFLAILRDHVARFERRAESSGRRALIRLNGTSDLPWERIAPDLFDSGAQFYDYTKISGRAVAHATRRFPSNYFLTFSRDENNESTCHDILSRGGQITVVVRNEAMRRAAGGYLAELGHKLLRRVVRNGIPQYPGYSVGNGDLTDLRHSQRAPIVALYAKGRAARDDSGFVLDIE